MGPNSERPPEYFSAFKIKTPTDCSKVRHLSAVWSALVSSKSPRENSITSWVLPSLFMERRLQTLVMKRKIAHSVHHARVLIDQKHIAVGKQMVNIPSFMVRVSSEQHIQLAATSCIKTGALGHEAQESLMNTA